MPASAGIPDSEAADLMLWSAFSCLVSELTKKGTIELSDLIENMQSTAIAHRNRGGENIAVRMHQFSEYLMKTAVDPPRV